MSTDINYNIIHHATLLSPTAVLMIMLILFLLHGPEINAAGWYLEVKWKTIEKHSALGGDIVNLQFQ